MDDLNRRMIEARRKAAREDQRPDGSTDRAPVHPDEPATPVGAGELRLEKRQGEWRYYLGEDRLRPGMAVEFWADPRLGWVRGTFQWGRRNTSVPTLRIPITHPDRPEEPIGEAEVTLPDGAICRWP